MIRFDGSDSFALSATQVRTIRPRGCTLHTFFLLFFFPDCRLKLLHPIITHHLFLFLLFFKCPWISYWMS